MEVLGAPRGRQLGIALAIATVVLSLTTAVIHYTIGGFTTFMGLMFYANAAGFAVLAAAFVAPIALARRLQWLTRLALIGFSAATAIGWVLFGARYDMGYLATGIEVLIVGVLLVDAYRVHGSPARVLRSLRFQLRDRRQAAQA